MTKGRLGPGKANSGCARKRRAHRRLFPHQHPEHENVRDQ